MEMDNINSSASVPSWAPRVPRSKIWRLYQADALGVHDEEPIEDVGHSLLARCDSFVAANEAVAGRARCPRCSAIVPHGGNKEELLRCGCGWELPWSEYFGTIQHRQLSGAGPVLSPFRDFLTRFPVARSSREKMVLIDQLLHGFHWYYKTGKPTRPVAINLIEGHLQDVIAFLDRLAYGDQSTPELLESKAVWDEYSKVARGSFRRNGEP